MRANEVRDAGIQTANLYGMGVPRCMKRSLEERVRTMRAAQRTLKNGAAMAPNFLEPGAKGTVRAQATSCPQ